MTLRCGVRGSLVAKVLDQIHRLVAAGEVRFTLKAVRGQAVLELGLDEADACDILRRLQPQDSRGRLVSEATGEWMYVFGPRIAETQLYLKVIIRTDCVVVSLHEQVDDEQLEAEGQ